MRFNTMLATSVAVIGLFLSSSTLVVAAPASEVTPAQIAAARTAADHEAIAASYDAEALAADKQAESHEMMAGTYRGTTLPKRHADSIVSHCERLVSEYRAAAKEYRSMAAEHRAMAKAAGK